MRTKRRHKIVKTCFPRAPGDLPLADDELFFGGIPSRLYPVEAQPCMTQFCAVTNLQPVKLYMSWFLLRILHSFESNSKSHIKCSWWLGDIQKFTCLGGSEA